LEALSVGGAFGVVFLVKLFSFRFAAVPMIGMGHTFGSLLILGTLKLAIDLVRRCDVAIHGVEIWED